MPTSLTDPVRAFIAEREHFYLATADGEGRPYVQHRGGPPGFLKVLGPSALGFADYSGNRRYVTVGNLAQNPNVFLFLMDYARRRRIKIAGTGRISTDPELCRSLAPTGYDAAVERAILIEVSHWETNCSQHITPRYTETELAGVTGPLRARIAELEARLAGNGQTTD